MRADRLPEFVLGSAGLAELVLEMVGRGYDLRVRVRGLSMWPFIKDGDVVRVSPVDDQGLQLGEVAALVHPATGKLVLHRVVGRCRDGLIIKADRAETPDGVFAPGDVAGRVRCVERGGRPAGWNGPGVQWVVAWLSRTGLLRPLVRVAAWGRRWLRWS